MSRSVHEPGRADPHRLGRRSATGSFPRTAGRMSRPGRSDPFLRAAASDPHRLDERPRAIAGGDDTRFIGVRLRPGVRITGIGAPDHPGAGDVDLESVGPQTSEWFRSLRQDPGRADELLAEAVDRWVRPADPVTRELLEALTRDQRTVEGAGRLSSRSIRRKVSKGAGAPPTFWIQLRRARAAGLRLVTTTDPLTEVAFSCGYADQPHMIRSVKAIMGQTPGQIASR
jgi:AraC-like DNA-binding protein